MLRRVLAGSSGGVSLSSDVMLASLQTTHTITQTDHVYDTPAALAVLAGGKQMVNTAKPYRAP